MMRVNNRRPSRDNYWVEPSPLPVGWSTQLTGASLDQVIAEHRKRFMRHPDWNTVLHGMLIVRSMLRGDRQMQGRTRV